APVPSPRVDRSRRPSRRGDHRLGDIGQDPPPASDGRGRAAAGTGQRHAGAPTPPDTPPNNAPQGGGAPPRRTVALYREAGVHPLYTLKSLLGFLIQIPVFIAVFDMLAEDFILYRVCFFL